MSATVDRAPQFPVNLELAGKPCLVVGAGPIALRKVRQLLGSGAKVTVIAPEVHEGFADLPVTLYKRQFANDDVAGQRLVITATGVRDVDQAVFDAADRHGIWVNSADDPQRCTFTLPAVLRRGDVMVTTSTAGTSPALSTWLRNAIAERLGPEFAEVAERLATERARVHADGKSTEDLDWTPVVERIVAESGAWPPARCLAAAGQAPAGQTPAGQTASVEAGTSIRGDRP
jgi:precorrin-2 dehydrogenase / sirohydrochlorin ferrochelatase